MNRSVAYSPERGIPRSSAGNSTSDLPQARKARRRSRVTESNPASGSAISWGGMFLWSLLASSQLRTAFAQSAPLNPWDINHGSDSFCKTLLPVEPSSLCGPVAKITSLAEIGNHVNHASKVFVAHLTDGSKGIFKPATDDKYGDAKYEVAAHRVDRLFQLGLVPETVLQTLNIHGMDTRGSLQRMKNGRHPSARDWDPTRHPKLMFLDVILGNRDRHHENALIAEADSSEIIAIDNNKSFRTFDKGDADKVLAQLKKAPYRYRLDLQTWDLIKKIDQKEFNRALGSLVEQPYLEEAWQRLTTFRDYLEPYQQLAISTKAWPNNHKLTIAYTESLEKSAVLAMQPLGQDEELAVQSKSGQGVYLVTMEEGYKAVFKADTPGCVGTYKHEVAAYRLAEVLGMRQVPPTVERTLTIGGKTVTGSLQLYVPETTHPNKELIHYRHFDRAQDAIYFDYVIGQNKRHNGNYLIDQNPSRAFYLIDHANTFSKIEDHRTIEQQTAKSGLGFYLPQDENLLDKFKSIRSEQIDEALRGWVKPTWIEKTKARVQSLQAHLAKAR